MSSALDDDTKETLADGRRAAGDVLRAAQKDLQKVFLVFLAGFLGSFYALRLYVWDFLKAVTEAQMDAQSRADYEIIAQTPFDVILLQAKIGLVVGVLLCLPVFVYYSRDALEERGYWPRSPVSRWKLVLIGLLAVVLFVAGVSYGYLVFFPFMFAFLANNAIAAGFTPTYSIVLWAQFIFLLTLSFGLAAQLPLAMSALSYADIIAYETFRDKWRYAVVGIFAFGAMFTPPDPFTQIMWATPMLVLYGASLYLSKVVVTAKRGSAEIEVGTVARDRWNLVAAGAVLGASVVYAFYEYGGLAAANGLLVAAGSDYRLGPAGSGVGLSPTVALGLYAALAALAGAVVVLAYYVYAELEAAVEPGVAAGRDPADIDLAALDEEGVRAAPPEAFADLSEEEATTLAGAAVDDGDHGKARAVLDRFDEVDADEGEAASGGEGGADGAEGTAADVADRTERAGGAFLEELTDGEQDEDDIGGYLTDITFVLDSITSRAFRIAAVFAIVLASTFGWLYTGGFGRVYDQFLSQLPSEVSKDSVEVVALHPMEALIFEVKFSTIIAVMAILPMLAYYAWPALREKGVVRGPRRVVFGWAGALLVGLLGGFALGYGYVAPGIISYLVADAVRADMVIAYRITNFFWLVFLTTAGIGLLADVPILMVLLNTAGVRYRAMRGRWREVTVGILAFAALFTPADIFTMFLITLPLVAAYVLGLGVLFVLTLGGRRELGAPRGGDPEPAEAPEA